MTNVYQIQNAKNAKPITRKLVSDRLRKARVAKSMTQADLADEVGITRQAISAFERGSKQPEGATLSSIANALGQPVSYFIGEAFEPFGEFSVRNFRQFGPATNKRNDKCTVISEWVATTAAYLNESINFPEPNIPEILPPKEGYFYNDQEIEDAADLTRKSWGLGFGPIDNLVRLLESKGVFVSNLHIIDDKVNAFSYWCGDKPLIVTSANNTTAARRRFDLAHELGHLVLHQGVSEEDLSEPKTLKRIEQEANKFAGAFLLPKASYMNEVFSTRLDSFVELKKRWKVSVAAQVSRCDNLGIFTDLQVVNLRKQISFKKWRTKEPLDDKIAIEEPSVINKAVKMAIDGGAISLQDMRSQLGFSPEIISEITGVDFNEGTSMTTEPILIIKQELK